MQATAASASASTQGTPQVPLDTAHAPTLQAAAVFSSSSFSTKRAFFFINHLPVDEGVDDPPEDHEGAVDLDGLGQACPLGLALLHLLGPAQVHQEEGGSRGPAPVARDEVDHDLPKKQN